MTTEYPRWAPLAPERQTMVVYLIGRAACAIGLHSAVRRDKWTPSIAAEVVTEFEQTHTCRRCAKVLGHVRLRWNGEDMIDVVESNEVNR